MRTSGPRIAAICLLLASTGLGQSSEKPTREFEVRDGRSYLGGERVKLWGLRCNNALLSEAVVERLVNNLDHMAAHGINLIGVSLHGTNGGFPDVDAGTSAFASNGSIIRRFGDRVERVCREADKRGMVVCLGILMPRKDEILRDEAAVRRAIEETGRLLTDRGLKNVFVNIFQEFNHPVRIDHDIFAEPDGASKKAEVTRWFKAVAPDIEAGICPNNQTGSEVGYPGCEVLLFHEDIPIPRGGFAVNVETPDRDLSGNEGVFNSFDIESFHKEWELYRTTDNAAMLFRSPYLEDVTGKQGTGPNFEEGGDGTDESNRGIRPYFDWLESNVGRWEFPGHVKASTR